MWVIDIVVIVFILDDIYNKCFDWFVALRKKPCRGGRILLLHLDMHIRYTGDWQVLAKCKFQKLRY